MGSIQYFCKARSEDVGEGVPRGIGSPPLPIMPSDHARDITSASAQAIEVLEREIGSQRDSKDGGGMIKD